MMLFLTTEGSRCFTEVIEVFALCTSVKLLSGQRNPLW